ncbi:MULTISPECIES: type I DNA topoisomerase [Brevibacterium]|uniref:DNA topoisomerase 1 n=1 Tax=Brevibacterium antiquum CNRZ 918 TaxID=1255637 RepID=A0A2H1IYY2_9MICO|nr:MULTISPECIES: type I DNA topoisomerase [Brevibacterium]SMX80384.1 DNA topoisomerase-1 [Brevibacterium antiquum CNRZ 918]HCG55420.1 type I DNA topoisomerase [Brevibacterium sp.]
MTTTEKQPRRLVIVESPTKARTIVGYLGEGYDVEASVGHIRDLPTPSELPADMKKGPYGKFAVDVDNNFDPYYRVDPGKKKKVTELKRLLKDADELYLATDEDREGEAIAWHLLEVLKPKIPVKRMVFHEITPEAIERALENTREIDVALVDAQETRRILDRLYGYEISPVLWRKIRAGLSAGRVQSVATRLVVERERERMAFVSADYWDLDVDLGLPDGSSAFAANLTTLDGSRVASGRDFNDKGELKNSSATVVDQAKAEELATQLNGTAKNALTVTAVESKPYSRKPAAPFTTSTLQQEAGRKLRMSARQAMRTAQSLYEHGYITYMRTDSSALSGQAISAARKQVTELYGPEFVPQSPRSYSGKQKSAQEAHEAIRPSGDSFRTPAQVSKSLSGDEFRLYDLIWKRTVASQMADAKGKTATIKVRADLADGHDAGFSASGTVITFRGFLAAYEEGTDAGRYDTKSGESRLPQVDEGQALSVVKAEADGHTTAPPPRFTEASLVKQLEELGIGRPSTYAATISVIQDRGYVTTRGNALVPSWLAFSVVRLLEEHFTRLVDYAFTADLESELDRIAMGEEDRKAWLARFYFGDKSQDREGLKEVVDDLGDIDAREVNTVVISEGVNLRVGRYGPYLEVPASEEGADPKRVSVPEDLAPDELTAAKAAELIESQGDGDRELGVDPETGHTIVAKNGRFGPYVSEILPEPEEKPKRGAKKPKPRTGSLFKSMDLNSIDLETALTLLSLPRVVGQDEEGTDITAQNGRYGPYLKKGTDSRSLTEEDQIFNITLDEALKIYAQPKQRGGRQAAAPLKELGEDPISKNPVVVKDGRFGPYVTDGEFNATLRKDDAVESMTIDRAAELLAEKRAKGPAKKKAPAKKAPAKKAPAKKTTAAKTTAAKKTTAKATAAKTAAKSTTASKSTTTAAKNTTAAKKTIAKSTTAAKKTTAAKPKTP